MPSSRQIIGSIPRPRRSRRAIDVYFAYTSLDGNTLQGWQKQQDNVLRLNSLQMTLRGWDLTWDPKPSNPNLGKLFSFLRRKRNLWLKPSYVKCTSSQLGGAPPLANMTRRNCPEKDSR